MALKELKQPKATAFVSYSRQDGRECAANLSKKLRKESLSLWRDLTDMEGGRDWWGQIVEAIQGVEYLILVLTPRAVQSSVVQREWRTARQLGVCVLPVSCGPVAGLDLSQLPRWMADTHVIDLTIPEQWDRLLAMLRSPCVTPRVPFMARHLPANFVRRPGEMERLVDSLLHSPRDRPVAVTAALRGAGGYGKTTLANAVCHDPRIQEEFHDGILWVDIGNHPGDLTPKVIDLIETLTGERPGFSNVTAAAAALGEILGDRDILLVIDDVWARSSADPFLVGGRRSARLITTRIHDALPQQATSVPVDQMTPGQAVELLRSGLDGAAEMAGFQDLARVLGGSPQLLNLANGAMRGRVARGETVAGSLAYCRTVLDRKGITGFDASAADRREAALAATLGLSLELLKPAEQERFGELAIFPEDTAIPLSVTARLWGATAGLDDFDSEELCGRLFGLSLLSDCNLETRTIRLHDTIRSFLRHQDRARLAPWNQNLIDTLPKDLWTLPTGELYLWEYIGFHLTEAGQEQLLAALLQDHRFLRAKLEAAGVNAMLADFDRAPSESSRKVAQAIRLSAHVLSRDPRQLAGQLCGRLDSSAVIASAREYGARPWIEPRFVSLTPPGGPLVRTIGGRCSEVTSVAVTPDGRFAVSGSLDNTLKVWDLATGAELLTLKGHSNSDSVAVTPDGRFAVSGSLDNTLKVWDLATGAEHLTLEGHSDPVISVAVTPDGRFGVSGSDDHTLKVWDLATGAERLTLKGHAGSVSTVAVTPDGRFAVSGSHDKTLKVWDLATGADRLTLKGHSDQVNSVAVTPDGRFAVSGYHDKTLKVWDLTTGAERLTPEGHSRSVNSIAVTPDGLFAVSGSMDNTLKVWDLATGAERRTLEGHSSWVRAVAVTPDGRSTVSGSGDRTLKVWDLATGAERLALKGHSNGISSIAVAPDGRSAVSGSGDLTLKVWDLATGAERLTLEGHWELVTSIAVTPDGRFAVSGSWDRTLKVWDLTAGEERFTLWGHSGPVLSVAVTPDGRSAVSGSGDLTLKVWDLVAGAERLTLHGHSSIVLSTAVTPDGRFAVSGAWGGSIRVWNLETAREHLRLDLDAPVHALAVSPDGETLVAGDQSGRVHFLRLHL